MKIHALWGEAMSNVSQPTMSEKTPFLNCHPFMSFLLFMVTWKGGRVEGWQ